MGEPVATIGGLRRSEDFLAEKAPSICLLFAENQQENTRKSKQCLLDLGVFHKYRKYIKYRKNWT
jgi:hypothetical protein